MRFHPRKAASYTLFLLFLAALWLPLLDNWRHLDTHAAPYERRTLAEPPQPPATLDLLSAWPASFESFFNDHFGFRNALIHWNSVARARGLGISSSDRVILGKDHWIFLRYPEAMNSYLVLNPLSEEKLKLVHSQSRKRAEWCAQRGIKYLDVWLPEKQTVYPEYLPGWMKPLHETDNLTRYLNYKQRAGGVEVLNLAPVLREARQDEQLFYSGDSHWNSHGAYAAYLAIARRLRGMDVPLRILKKEDLVPVEMTKVGDVSEMLNMEAYYQEHCRELEIRQPDAFTATFTPEGYTLPDYALVHAMENTNQDLPRLVMFADSFGYGVYPFLGESFSRVVYARFPTFNVNIIQQEKPAVVLELHVSRHLEDDTPLGSSVLGIR